MTGMALTGVTDPVTLAFYHRMNIGGTEGENDVRGQCLRYTRWPGKKTEEEEEEEEEDDENDSVPLWLSSNNRPPTTTFPPPCQYCGSPRDFEFQILPQMLSCLMVPATAVDNNKHNKATTTEADLAVLLEAASMIESGMVLPVGFKERHDEACANARSSLLGATSSSTSIDGSSSGGVGVDWGTIAVYTCTGSCGNGELVCEETGCYREEVAWMQPPLD